MLVPFVLHLLMLFGKQAAAITEAQAVGCGLNPDLVALTSCCALVPQAACPPRGDMNLSAEANWLHPRTKCHFWFLRLHNHI